MHLTDKRVFQLGDSVYKAIERTKGLATEIDMLNQSTRMAVELIGKQQEDEEKDSVLLRHVVNPEVWEKYKEQLGRKMKKDYNQITVSDLTDRSSRIKSTLFRKGEMPTFLDAWLSGVAMKQGKWVGGVEDMDDQAFGGDDMEEDIQNLLFDQEYGKGLEGLLKVYVAQRLDYIDSMMYRSDSAKKDFIIIRRNRKMARRMDSLMSIRSTLFAIGAGHLPGDSGLITLLRKRGYTVTPVFSSKKISAEQYQYKAVETEWKIVTDPENGYTMKMPGDPESLPLPGLPEFAMKTYFDLLTMKMYFTIGMPVAHNLRSLGPDTLFERVKQRFGANSAITAEKKIMVRDRKSVV